MNHRQNGDEVTKTTVRRGLDYDVTVHRLIPPTDLPPETIFSCAMEIPNTRFSLREETMYFPGKIQPRASQVSGKSPERMSLEVMIIMLITTILSP